MQHYGILSGSALSIKIFSHRNTYSVAYKIICQVIRLVSYGPRCEKTYLQRFANNKGPDEPVHSRSLISAFVIRLMESIISKFAASKFSRECQVSVAEETDLSLALTETPKTGFVATPLIYA